MPTRPRARHFWPITAAVFLTDCATKSVAERNLAPEHVPHPVLGDLLRFTLVYNPGSAMSLVSGRLTAVLLSVAAASALAVLWLWYRRSGPSAWWQVTALALVWGGAAGNLWDRLRMSRGVVDSIDVGLGSTRFWVFNVADAAVTAGALMLVVVVSRQPSGAGAD